MTSLSSSSALTSPNSHGMTVAQTQDAGCHLSKVEAGRKGLTDAERESHIRACGRLMEIAMDRWYETSDFQFVGEAHRWRLLMEEAIKGRSATQVKKMERERGLE